MTTFLYEPTQPRPPPSACARTAPSRVPDMMPGSHVVDALRLISRLLSYPDGHELRPRCARCPGRHQRPGGEKRARHENSCVFVAISMSWIKSRRTRFGLLVAAFIGSEVNMRHQHIECVTGADQFPRILRILKVDPLHAFPCQWLRMEGLRDPICAAVTRNSPAFEHESTQHFGI